MHALQPLTAGDVRIDADIEVLPIEGVKYGEFGLYKRQVKRWGTNRRELDAEEIARPGDEFHEQEKKPQFGAAACDFKHRVTREIRTLLERT